MSRPFFHVVNTLALLLGVSLILIGAYPFVRANLSTQWQAVDGVVRVAEVRSEEGSLFGLSLSHQVRLQYDYHVERTAYQGKRVDFGFGSQSFLLNSFARRIVERYPVGKSVRVYFDPGDPTNAVLERVPSLGSSVFWMVVGLFLVGVGFMVNFRDTLDLLVDDR